MKYNMHGRSLFFSALNNISILLLVLLFTYTAADKLIQRQLFTHQLSQQYLLHHFKNILPVLLPAIEGITALLLCFPKTQTAGLTSATLLMLAFTIYIAAMLLSGSKLPCSCGSVLAAMSWKQHLLFNILFLFLPARLLLQARHKHIGTIRE